MIEKVVSGGQTGADQAGLYAARKFNIPTGGWAPYGWRTKESLLKMYGLKEHAKGYRERTIQNIKDSDGTMVLSLNWESRGTVLTVSQTGILHKPLFKVDLDDPPDVFLACDWVIHNEVKVLNVAGNADMHVLHSTVTYLQALFTHMEVHMKSE